MSTSNEQVREIISSSHCDDPLTCECEFNGQLFNGGDDSLLSDRSSIIVDQVLEVEVASLLALYSRLPNAYTHNNTLLLKWSIIDI